MAKSKKSKYSDIKVTKTGFEGMSPEGFRFSANFPLFLIRIAWERGCPDIEPHADGFGPGLGTMGGDWSGIRDSSVEATNKMLEAALNFLFPQGT
jgi:hypothetical protein